MMTQFGCRLESGANAFRWDDVLVDLRSLIHQHSFVLLRGFDISNDRFIEMANSIGRPIEYEFGTVLNMRPREDTNESQFKNKSMALHQDSLLNKSEKARYLAFKCLAAPTSATGGETLLTNNRRFFQIIPRDLLSRLQQSSLLYKSNFPGYYKSAVGDGWVEQKAIIKHPVLDEEVLFIALDDPSDPNRNYVSKFANVSAEESEKLMLEIDRYLRDGRVLYAHAWQENDILICDNFLTCHGRNEFGSDEPRHLMRLALS